MKNQNFTVTCLESDMPMVGTLIDVFSPEDLNERLEIALTEHFDEDIVIPKPFDALPLEGSFMECDFNVEVGEEGGLYKCRLARTWIY